jgi:protein-S-isoprenylcysteine O-methyltransferase Ste14
VAQYAGMWLIYPTLPFGIVLLAWLMLVVDRIRHEERVLMDTFPEYAAYCGRVPALASLRAHLPLHYDVPNT